MFMMQLDLKPLPVKSTNAIHQTARTVAHLPEDLIRSGSDRAVRLQSANLYPIGCLDEPLAKYRERADGPSKAAVATAMAKLFLIERLDELYPRCVAEHHRECRHWMVSARHAPGRGLLRPGGVKEGRDPLRQSWTLRPGPTALGFWIASFLGKSLCCWLDGLKTRHSRDLQGARG